MTKPKKSALAGRHTKGEWIAVGFQVETDNEDPMVPDICNCYPPNFDQRDTRSYEEVEANARRIAVCVNACNGIPNAQLEMGSVAFINVFNEYNALKLQKRALLAALNLIEVDKDGDGFICREAMEQVREAIAQAKEGAGQ